MSSWIITPTRTTASYLREDSPHVTIIVWRNGDKYDMLMLPFGDPVRAPINLYPDDIPAISTTLRVAFEKLLRVSPSSPNYAAERVVAARQLAKAGNDAFVRVFSDARAMQVITSLLSNYDQLRLQIVSSAGFSFPWEMIYTGDLTAETSFGHFWGMKHIITRSEAQPQEIGPPVIAFSSLPTVGLLADTAVPSVANKEIPYFNGLKDSGKIVLKELRALDPDREVEEFKVLQDFWSQPLNLAQIACHACYDKYDRSLTYLNLSDDFRIRLGDMRVYNVSIKNRPLLILNACGTGNLNPLSTSNFVEMFVEQGALGVVATECVLPDRFAAAFAAEFYNRLLEGAGGGVCYVGECLLETRRHFLEEHGDPTGLLYSMYAPPSTRLENTLGGT